MSVGAILWLLNFPSYPVSSFVVRGVLSEEENGNGRVSVK